MRYLILLMLLALPAGAQTITKVVPQTDSVLVQFTPLAGAVDYRCYTTEDPSDFKYMGQDAASTEIEMNGLTPGGTYHFVVEALDSLGPFPYLSTYTPGNLPAYPAFDPMKNMLGMNDDIALYNPAVMTTNGTGPATNNPKVLGTSAPVAGGPDGAEPLPSGSDATLEVYDDFVGKSVMATQTSVSPDQSAATYTLKTTQNLWTLQYMNADVTDSMPFIADNHFMDVIFDSGTPGTNNPLHQGHAAMLMSTAATADLSGGRIVHITMEVDAHVDGRRWPTLLLIPAGDKPQDLAFTPALSGNAFELQVFSSTLTSNLFYADSTGQHNLPIAGAAGQAPTYGVRTLGDGRGFDNRSRFDLYISKTHYAVYEDGVLQQSLDLPGPGLTFDSAQVYFVHQLYHTANEVQELTQYSPQETFWINVVPYSDERHWDDMGYESLPAATSWDSLAARNTHFASTRYGGGTGGSGGSSGSTVTGTVVALDITPGNEAFTFQPTSGAPISLSTRDRASEGLITQSYALKTKLTITYDAGAVVQEIKAS